MTWWNRKRKAAYLATLFNLETKVAELEMRSRPPVMDIKYTVNGSDIVRMNTLELYLALKYAGYGAGIKRGEWYELLGLGGAAFVAGDKSVVVELSVRETDNG